MSGLPPPPQLPYGMWLDGKSPDELKAMLIKKKAQAEAKKSSGKKKAAPKKASAYKKSTGGRRGGYSRGCSGNNIIYPNVVGRGPYHASGTIGWGSPDSFFRGSLSGGISDTVQGLGGYTVRRNSMLSAVDLGQDPPVVRNTNKGEATIFNHREYIGDLFSAPATEGVPTPFKVTKYALNPGNNHLFPFLCPIACNFQEYEIRGMLVELKSLSSDYAANLALGSMFMAADYNVLGNAPSTKQMVENMEYASSAKPSKSMIMPIECESQNNGLVHKYVCMEGEYDGGDKRLYDWANLYIGTQGIPQGDSPVAEIWVTYEIALFKPILDGNRGHNPISTWDASHIVATITPVAEPLWLGSGSTTSPGSDPEITVDHTLQRINFPHVDINAGKRRWLFLYHLSSSVAQGEIQSPALPTINSPPGSIANIAGGTFCLSGVNAATNKTYLDSTSIINMAFIVEAQATEVQGLDFYMTWPGGIEFGTPAAGNVRSDIYITALPGTFDPVVV